MDGKATNALLGANRPQGGSRAIEERFLDMEEEADEQQLQAARRLSGAMAGGLTRQQAAFMRGVAIAHRRLEAHENLSPEKLLVYPFRVLVSYTRMWHRS